MPAGLLSMLAGLGQAGIAADTGAMQGAAVKRDREQRDLLAQLAQQRQAAQDAQEAERNDLLNALTRAQTAKMSAPPEPDLRIADGAVVDMGTAQARPIQGLPQTPKEPARGSPEALAIIAAEARARQVPDAGTGGTRAPRTPTGEQEKSYNWHKMMQEASPILDELESKIRPDAIWAAINAPEWSRPALNRFLNADEQRYYNALRKFGAGQLRKETGAAFGAGELADVFSRYGPTGGNTPEVIAQIRAGRHGALENMALMATPARLYYESLQRGGIPMDTPQDAAAEGAGFQGGGVQPGAPARPVTPPSLFEAWKRARGGRP